MCTGLHAVCATPAAVCRRQLRRLRAARAANPEVRTTPPPRIHGPRGLQTAGRLGLELCPQCKRCPPSPSAAALTPRGVGLRKALLPGVRAASATRTESRRPYVPEI